MSATATMSTIDGASLAETGLETTGQHTAGWYDDPTGTHRMRYHSGVAWTDHVTHFGPTPCRGCGRAVS